MPGHTREIEQNRADVQALLRAGMKTQQIIEQLGVSRATVDRVNLLIKHKQPITIAKREKVGRALRKPFAALPP